MYLFKWVTDRMTINDVEDLHKIKGMITLCEDGQVKDISQEEEI